MPVIPVSHIEDAHKMSADAEIELYELTPAGTTAKVRFKNDNTVTYLGNEFAGLPLNFTGVNKNAEGTMVQPSLTIGQSNIDLSMFKGLVFDGTLDNARIEKHTVLLSDLLANNDIKVVEVYRVKRVDNYGASQISLSLATFSVAGPTSIPFRQYIPPAFPFVKI